MNKLSLLFLFTFLLFACVNDDFDNVAETSISKFKSIDTLYNLKDIKHQTIKKNIDFIEEMSSQAFGKRPAEESDTLAYNGIQINKNFIVYYQDIDSDYHSYTFPVLNTPENEGLQNILISYDIQNNTYTDFLVHYDISNSEIELIDNGQQVENIGERVTFEELDENYFFNEILGKVMFNDGCYYLTNCYPDTCCSGKHIYGQKCDCTESEGQAQDTGETFTTLLGCPDGGGGDPPPPPPPSSTNGSNHTGGPNSHSSVSVGCRKCVEEEEEEEVFTPYNKIKKAFEDFPDLKTKLQALKTKTSESVEHGFYALKDGNGINAQAAGTNGKIDFNQNPLKKYLIIAHSHNSPADATYSVFSWDDLWWLANAIREGSIKTGKFVMFLTTADGTNYALTISNPSSFTNFFIDAKGSPGETIDVDKLTKLSDLQNKFFNYKDAPIDESNQTNSELADEEKGFLQMVHDAGLGTEVFELDDNFENPDELTLNNPDGDNPSVNEESCE